MVDLAKLTWTERKALSQQFIKYGWSLLGLPYRWGGDDPMKGFDCSGLVIECLKRVGLFPPNEDDTADGLCGRYYKDIYGELTVPCLLFWLKNGKANHVAIYIGSGCFIEAGGGGSSTITEQNAIDQNAFVRMNHITNKPNFECADIFNLRCSD